MDDKKEQLLSNVKYAVQKYGMEGITVRNISEVCGVNDSHLHRFFKNKDELLMEAYKRENTEILNSIIENMDETKNVPLDFKTKVRLHFHRTWNDFISDSARLVFCVYYYHSSSFKSVKEFHNKQIDILYERIKNYFQDKQTCVRAMYSLLTFLYDNAKQFIDSKDTDAVAYEEMAFNSYYALLCSFLTEKH